MATKSGDPEIMENASRRDKTLFGGTILWKDDENEGDVAIAFGTLTF